MNNLTKYIYPIAGLFCVGVVWELLLRFAVVSPILLPYPKQVLIELKTFCFNQTFWLDFLDTIFSWSFGLLSGIIIGTIGGLLFSINNKIWLMVEPIIEFFRSLPSIVLVPLISLFLGIGLKSKIVCVIVVVAVTIISTIGIALRNMHVTYVKLQHSWKLSTKSKVVYIYLPEIASHLLIAIKATIPLALIVAIAADMLIATDNGIGKIITDSLAVFDTPKMYAAIIVVGILGYTSAKLSTLLEKKIIHWNTKNN